MLNSLASWEIAGFIFVVAVGTLLHFVYHWSGNNPIVGIISPINESTWEHLKLLFLPMLLFSIIEYFSVGRAFPGFIAAKAFGILLGMLVILAIFYTYTGIFGENYLWADILTFIIGVAVAYRYSLGAISRNPALVKLDGTGIVILILLLICFGIFTFSPPQIPLFMDSITKGYGIPKGKRR